MRDKEGGGEGWEKGGKIKNMQEWNTHFKYAAV